MQRLRLKTLAFACAEDGDGPRWTVTGSDRWRDSGWQIRLAPAPALAQVVLQGGIDAVLPANASPNRAAMWAAGMRIQ